MISLVVSVCLLAKSYTELFEEKLGVLFVADDHPT